MSALDDVLCCRGVAAAVAADRGDTTLDAASAELAELRAQSVALGRCREALVDHHQRDVVEAARDNVLAWEQIYETRVIAEYAGRLAERAAVVAWLRDQGTASMRRADALRELDDAWGMAGWLADAKAQKTAADAIERGEHVGRKVDDG